MAHVLVTRPSRQAEKTADALRRLGHTCLVEPMLAIEPVSSSIPDGVFDAAIATSANALPALETVWDIKQRTNIPLLVTGAATAEAARKLGFAKTSHVAGSAIDLFKHVPDWMVDHHLSGESRLLYPSAEILAHDLAELLSESAIGCSRWIVYRSVPVDDLSASAKTALAAGEVDCVFLYSKRTAQTFVHLMQQNNLSLANFRTLVLSHDILESLPTDMKSRAESAAGPNEDELLRLVGS